MRSENQRVSRTFTGGKHAIVPIEGTFRAGFDHEVIDDLEQLFQKYYYSRPDFVDGTSQLHQLCRKHIPAGGQILEVGAGPSNPTSAFLSSLGNVTGLDISDEVLTNRSLASAHLYDGGKVPFQDQSFDACVSDFVLEHVEDTRLHFGEIARVLKPGGVYCFRTPNVLHYVGIVSKLLPHKAHLAVANRLRRLKEAHDPYPTYYRANTTRTIQALSQAAHLEIVKLAGIEPEPSYGRYHALLFYPMMFYERIVNSSDHLQNFRSNILGVLRKP